MHTYDSTVGVTTDTADRLWVEPWVDPLTDELGHDARSPYVERFWLGFVGPSATWLLRAFAYGFDASPAGYELAVRDMARVLGIGDRTGRHSPMQRTLTRLCQFGLARQEGGRFVARKTLPWLEPRQVKRLSEVLRAEHDAWEAAESAASPAGAMRRRAASIALTTVRTGGSTDDAERLLIRAQLHPSLTRTLAEWATAQHELSVLCSTRELLSA